jgi:hypothetical protein
MSVLGQGT